MTVQEAEKILNIDKTVKRVDQISESTNYFIFNVVPAHAKNNHHRLLTPPIAVEKRTGKMLAFNPMMFSDVELMSVKRIY